MPKFQLILTESIPFDDGHPVVSMRIILSAASGELINDPDCQRSALNIIVNCVCGPINRLMINNSINMATTKASSFVRMDGLTTWHMFDIGKNWQMSNDLMLMLENEGPLQCVN